MSSPAEFNFAEGQLLLIDKPLHWTSADVVRKIKNTSGMKTGHAGTLDPLATGLLILGLGKATRLLTDIQGQVKVYTGIIRLGSTTPSFDLETQPENFAPTQGITEENIEAAMQKLTGTISQTPPVYSAIKVSGKRSYDLARAGKQVELKPRTLVVDEFALVKKDDDDVHFSVTCSKGTYIRALADDLGRILGCGAHLAALRREAIGNYSVQDAWSMKDLLAALQRQKATVQTLPEESNT